MREQALPFLRKCIHPMDDDGAPLSDNFLMSEVLRYGVRDALPHAVVPGDAKTMLWMQSLPGHEKSRRLRKNARCGSRPCPIGSRYT